MKTGMTRPIDDTGRIVIPKEIREQMKLGPGVRILFDICDGKLVLEKYVPANSYKQEAERLQKVIRDDQSINAEKARRVEALLSDIIDVLNA